jgi:hypothetical protein
MTYGIGVLDLHKWSWFGPGMAMFLLVLMTYLAGRVHQFFRQTVEREVAFRDGYNQATKSLFALATRTAKGLPPAAPAQDSEPPAAPATLRGFASVPGEVPRPLPARHRAEGRRKPSLYDTKKMEWVSDQAA